MVLKRKISSHNECIDPKKATGAHKKPATKADLLKELKTLKNLNEVLEIENKMNLDKISLLEERLQSFQNQKPSKCLESQFFAEEI